MVAVMEGDLATRMKACIGRHADKVHDWDAFPASRGFPELARSQIRYIGAGGSPKIDDPSTLRPDHFTLSMVHQPVGQYGASHAHEVEEAFLVIEGVLTVGWEWDGEVILARLGPKDMVLQASNIAHGFRNDGVEPVLVSIMLGKARPNPPQYVCHPKTHSPEIARAFGAQPGKTHLLSWESSDPRHRLLAQHIVRYSQQKPQWHEAGFGKLTYVGEGGAPAGSYRKDLVFLPRGAGVRDYERPVEEAYLVLEGCITAGWEENGTVVEQRLGPKDLILNPPGQAHWFRNDGFGDAQFMMIVGEPKPENVRFRAA
ncbi:MAG: cupin domain-containing protein [Burkholderiales bacterium]